MQISNFEFYLFSLFFRGRKLNSNLERAIQEAMSELDRQTDEPTATTVAHPNVTNTLTTKCDNTMKENAATKKIKVGAGSAKKKKR